MYEDKTVDSIHSNMLNNIDDKYEKSVGYPTYDFTKSYAIEESALYFAIDAGINKMYVKNLSGDELTTRVKEWKGITRKLASAASGIVTVIGNGTVNAGDLFSTPNKIQFKATETVTVTNTADINIVAVVAGSSGNLGANSITQMPVTLQGITSCTNANATTGGYDQETDDSLKERYYASLQTPATSGNRYHYLTWATEVDGVGSAKVFPLWNGNGTVKVCIINSNKRAADSALVSSVAACIEDNRPIGATVTVESATEKAINISATLTIDTKKYTLSQVQTAIEANMTSFFKSIAFVNNYVSYAPIGNIIFNTDGVIDYTNLTLNNGTVNIALQNEEIAVLGTLNLGV